MVLSMLSYSRSSSSVPLVGSGGGCVVMRGRVHVCIRMYHGCPQTAAGRCVSVGGIRRAYGSLCKLGGSLSCLRKCGVTASQHIRCIAPQHTAEARNGSMTAERARLTFGLKSGTLRRVAPVP